MAREDNYLTYLRWRGDLLIKDAPFNEIDAIILCELSYLKFEGIVPQVGQKGKITIAEVNRRYKRGTDRAFWMGEREDLLPVLAKSKRFASMTLHHYVSTYDLEKQQQFAAIHVDIAPGHTFIAFRGTDSSVVGWREDFNMSYMMPVPAQQSAVDYVNGTAKRWFHKYSLGGHSKGGNLAVYSGIFCKPSIQKKLVQIYSFDGPGFNRKVVKEPAYKKVESRIQSFVPESSVVGLLMEHEEDYKVVLSTENSILQHRAGSWMVRRDGFILTDMVNKNSLKLRNTTKEWLKKLSPEEKKRIVDNLFVIFEQAEITDLVQILSPDSKLLGRVFKAMVSVPKEEREFVGRIMKLFLEETKKK